MSSYTLTELMKLTKPELINMAKTLGVKGYSTKKKPQIAELISNHMGAKSGDTELTIKLTTPKRKIPKRVSPPRRKSPPALPKKPLLKRVSPPRRKELPPLPPKRKSPPATPKRKSPPALPKKSLPKRVSPPRRKSPPRKPLPKRVSPPRRKSPPRRSSGLIDLSNIKLYPRVNSAFLDSLEASAKICEKQNKIYNVSTKQCDTKHMHPPVGTKYGKTKRGDEHIEYVIDNDDISDLKRAPTPKRVSPPRRKLSKHKRKSPPRRVSSPKRVSPKRVSSQKGRSPAMERKITADEVRRQFEQCVENL